MASHATVWTGILSSAATSVSIGHAVVPNSDGQFVIATTANRATYGRARGVAKSAASGINAAFEYQVAGIISAADSGIGTGTAGDWVIVSATGTLERDSSPDSGEDVIGRCPHTSGDVQVMPGVWDSTNTSPGGGDPTGTGVATVTSGVMDAAATGTTGTGLIARQTSPTFLTTTSYGASPSTAGEHRYTNNEFLWWRGAGSNYKVLGLDASDVIQLGTGSGADIHINASTSGDTTVTAQALLLDINGMQIGSATEDFGGGVGVVGLDDAADVPTTNPTAGIIIYSQGGVWKWRVPDGTIRSVIGEDATNAIAHTATSATCTTGKTTLVAKVGEHQTTTATTAAVTAVTTTIADNTTATVDFVAIMRATGATAKAGRWAGRVTYYRNGGAPVLVGSATYDTAVETTAGDDVAFNLSTNDLQIRVTSADADDRNWSIEARVQTVTNAA